MTAPWSILPASEDDVPPIGALLRENGLPDNDIPQYVGDFFVARSGDTIVGAAGLERYGADALLRSVVVAEPWRGRGVAAALVDSVLRHARSAGFARVYLLTQTAATYFAQRGFNRVERESLPAALLDSAQVTRLCPASAKIMVRSL